MDDFSCCYFIYYLLGKFSYHSEEYALSYYFIHYYESGLLKPPFYIKVVLNGENKARPCLLLSPNKPFFITSSCPSVDRSPCSPCSFCNTISPSPIISSRQCTPYGTTPTHRRCCHTSPSTRRRDVHSSNTWAHWGHSPSCPSLRSSCRLLPSCLFSGATPQPCPFPSDSFPSPAFQWAHG